MENRIDLNNLNNLNNLPPEMLLTIFSFFPPESLAVLALVNKNFHEILNDEVVWKNKFKIHFPHVFRELEHENLTGWKKRFGETYLDEYKNIPANRRRLFSFVKEGDLERLKKANVQLNDLIFTDKNRMDLRSWAEKNNHQHILDYFFPIVVKKCMANKDLRLQEFSDYTILHYAILFSQSEDTLNALLKNPKIKSAINVGGPLVLAAQQGKTELIVVLLANGALIDEKIKGFSALFAAAKNGHYETVKLLLDKNADQGNGKPLYAAIANQHVEVAKMLLGKRDNIQYLDAEHNTFFHAAAKSGQLEIIKLLIEKNHDPVISLNAFNKQPRTPLMLAAGHGHQNVFEFLYDNLKIKMTIDMSIRLLRFAILGGNLEIVKFLVAKNPLQTENYKKMLEYAVGQGRPIIAEFFLTKCESIISREATLFFAAAKAGDIAFAAQLRNKDENKIDINMLTTYEQKTIRHTPLHAAIISHQVEFVRWLAREADVNIKDSEGKLPFSYIFYSSSSKADNLAMAKALLEVSDMRMTRENLELLLAHTKKSAHRWGEIGKELEKSLKKHELVAFINNLEQQDENVHKFSLKIKLGFIESEVKFGYPTKDVKAAAMALKQVVLNKAELKTLVPHMGPLAQGDLEKLYHALVPEDKRKDLSQLAKSTHTSVLKPT